MPKAVVTDGYSIDRHIPLHLRDMFYKSAYPDYTYCTTNGYGPYDFSTQGLVMYLPLFALQGSPIQSVDAYKHSCTVTGATWLPDSRVWTGGDDDINLVNVLTTSLAATTAGTLMMWHRPDDATPAALEALINFMDTSATEMVELYHRATTGELVAQCFVAGALQWVVDTDGASPYSDATWALTGVTHNATAPIIYVNGAAPTQVFDDQTDKTIWFSGCAGIDNGYMGTRSLGGAGKASFMNGRVGEAWIYNRALSAAEMLYIYNCTTWRYR